MSTQKYWRLVGLLMKKTSEGTAQWEPTSREGVFALSLPDYSVRVWKAHSEEGSDDVMFQIVNSSGTVIDTFRDVDAAAALDNKTNAYRDMEKLFDQARRAALGVEKALDTLINELGKS